MTLGLEFIVKLSAHRAELPGNVDMITGSALTPLRESVTGLTAPAYGQEGGASSRLARECLWVRGKDSAGFAPLSLTGTRQTVGL